MTLRTERVFGLDFVADSTIDEVARHIADEGRDARPEFRCVVTPNTDHIVRYDRFPAERRVAERSWMLLPDGAPIIWTSRLVGRPLARRLPGSDLFNLLWPELVARGTPTVVVAPSDAVAAGLSAEHRHSEIVVPPMVDVHDPVAVRTLIDEIVAAVDRIDARFVFVAISMQKHHLVADHLEQRWSNAPAPPVVLLVGTSPEFYLGLVKRAPHWMQRAGLEWLHRLLSDPRRLAKRYLVDDLLIFKLMWREWRRRRGAQPAAGVE